MRLTLWCNVQIPEHSLPAPKSKRSRQSITRGANLRTDAVWHEGHGMEFYLLSTRGDLTKFRCELTENAIQHIMSDAAPKSGSKRSRGEFERSVDAMAANIVSKAQETLCAASSSTTMRIARVAYAHTPLLISPPEIHHSPAHNIIYITTRSGVNVYTDDSLDAIEKGYAEGVDNTPLVSARLAAGGSVLLALPHPKSGHMAGGVYFFRRGFAGDIRLKPGPGVAGGIVYFDVHPANGTIIGMFHDLVRYLSPVYAITCVSFMLRCRYNEPRDGIPAVSALSQSVGGAHVSRWLSINDAQRGVRRGGGRIRLYVMFHVFIWTYWCIM